jgi:hypothetical protein
VVRYAAISCHLRGSDPFAPAFSTCPCLRTSRFSSRGNVSADRQELLTRAGPVTEAEDVVGRATAPEGEVGPRKGTRPRKKNLQVFGPDWA